MDKYGKILFAVVLFFSVSFDLVIAEEFLTWQDCIREAAKNHPDLISAQEGIRQSEASKKSTASSLFPQINSSAGASTSKTRTISGSTTTSKTSESYSYGASATQLVFDGFKTLDNLQAASENIKAARYNYKYTSSAVRLRLRTAFIDVLKAQELLKITEEIYNVRSANFELITLRYESGIEHKGALLTAEANLAQAKFEISQAKRTLEVAQRELIKEMGRIQFSPVRVEGVFKVSNTTLEKPDFEALAKNNPSLGKLMVQKKAASFGLKAAEADFFPQISAQAGANRNGSHWPPEDEQWNAGLSVSLPVFEGGSRLAEVSRAKASLNQAQANERSTKDGLILTLEQSWVNLQNALETVEVQKKFLEAAEERAKISESQYSLGLIQFDNWTIIEDDMVRNKKAFLDTQVNALLAEANWVQAKGETLEYAQE